MDEAHDGKVRALRERGTLNPRPQRVTDQLFQGSEFFDPRDLLLVKYEMLRRRRIDGQSATAAARAFGFSRVAFYQALAAFNREGLPGLLPRPRGPKQAHKLTDTVLEFVDRQRAADGQLRATELAARVRQRLGLSVHPRSIERALARRAKRGRHAQPS